MADIDLMELDALDRDILRHLQADGRLTNVELAKRVRLSPSPCLRRVKSLEERGYIRGYTALLDRDRIGRALHVVVMVSLTSQRQDTLEAFERAVVDLEEVLECHLVAGESDYLLTVAVGGSRRLPAVLHQAPGRAAGRRLPAHPDLDEDGEVDDCPPRLTRHVRTCHLCPLPSSSLTYDDDRRTQVAPVAGAHRI